MRTVKFLDVWKAVCRKNGRDPDTISLTDGQKQAVADAINLAIEEGWEYAMFPEMTQTEERAFRSAWSTDLTYDEGNEVYVASTDKYYESNADDNSGNDPTTDTDETYWSEITSLNTWLPYEPRDHYAIGTIIGIYNADPDRYADTRKSHDYVITAKGAQVQASVGTTVWLKHRMRCPVFTMTEWSESGDYSLGDVVLRTSYGECYQAQLNSSGEPIWQKIDFPFILRQFVIYHAYAQLLDTDGKDAQAKKYMQMAYAALERTATAQLDQQGIAENVRYRA